MAGVAIPSLFALPGEDQLIQLVEIFDNLRGPAAYPMVGRAALERVPFEVYVDIRVDMTRLGPG